MPCKLHGYKVNQTPEVSLRIGALRHWLVGQQNNVVSDFSFSKADFVESPTSQSAN